MLLEGLVCCIIIIISCSTVYRNNQFIMETRPSKTWSDNKSEYSLINTASFQSIAACAAWIFFLNLQIRFLICLSLSLSSLMFKAPYLVMMVQLVFVRVTSTQSKQKTWLVHFPDTMWPLRSSLFNEIRYSVSYLQLFDQFFTWFYPHSLTCTPVGIDHFCTTVMSGWKRQGVISWITYSPLFGINYGANYIPIMLLTSSTIL